MSLARWLHSWESKGLRTETSELAGVKYGKFYQKEFCTTKGFLWLVLVFLIGKDIIPDFT